MVISPLSLACFLVGLFVFWLASRPTTAAPPVVQELGRCLMWCGLLAFLLAAHATMRIG